MSKIVSTYGLTALILILSSFFVYGNLDFVSHDTYLVISNAQILLAIGCIFLLFSLITWSIDKVYRRMSSMLNWLHYGLTVICLIIIALLIWNTTTQSSTFKDYSVLNEIEEYEYSTSINEWLTIAVLVLVLSQQLFVANIVRAFFINKEIQ